MKEARGKSKLVSDLDNPEQKYTTHLLQRRPINNQHEPARLLPIPLTHN